jgi:hypothetical protein
MNNHPDTDHQASEREIMAERLYLILDHEPGHISWADCPEERKEHWRAAADDLTNDAAWADRPHLALRRPVPPTSAGELIKVSGEEVAVMLRAEDPTAARLWPEMGAAERERAHANEYHERELADARAERDAAIARAEAAEARAAELSEIAKRSASTALANVRLERERDDERRLADAAQAEAATLRAACSAVPRILYGLGLEDPRQAVVAQKAIDVCRAALATPAATTASAGAFIPTTPAEQAANALLCDMTGNRSWDVPCAARHLERFATPAATSGDGAGDGWIACSERMPANGPCLVYEPKSGQPIRLAIINDIRGWTTANLVDGWATHWRPLPAPPHAAKETSDGH